MDAEELDFIKLLNLLFRVVEANRGPSTGDDDRFWYAEGLATKFFFHAASILYLSRRTKLPDFPNAALEFPDSASIDVLTRAAFETFLTFHYVFFEPKTDDEKNYHYCAWKLAGLIERQNFPASYEDHKEKLKEEKKEVEVLSENLRANANFQQLKERQKRRVLRGEWRLLTWREIGAKVGFSKILSSHMYKHLSGYTHSSWSSILQIKQSLREKEQALLISSSMSFMSIVSANFIREYCELFPRAKAALNADARESDMVDVWIQIGQRLDG
jgi:hypothetical protein